jgi:hypothetical protein
MQKLTMTIAVSLIALIIPAYGIAPHREDLQTIRLHTGDRLLVYTQGGKTYAELASSPRTKIVLTRGKYACKASYENFAVVGQTAGGAIILREVYHTDANPDGFCGAGEEEILQVVATKPVCKQTFTVEIASCVASRELSEDGVKWNPKDSLLSLAWSDSGEELHNEKSSYHITANGSVELISAKRTKVILPQR